MNRRTFVCGAISLAADPIRASNDPVGSTSWPAGCSPLVIGSLVARRFAETPLHRPINYDGGLLRREYIDYHESCAWYGALAFARVAQVKDISDKLKARFEPLFGSCANLIPTTVTALAPAFAVVPLEFHLQGGGARYLAMGKKIADRQREPPALRGLSSQPRHWIADEVYLITVPQVQAFRATGNHDYIDRAAEEVVEYIERLQQPHGLFYHSSSSPWFWSRGNGWAAAGMAEVLLSLPSGHKHQERISVSYQALMGRLTKYQGEDGLWKQIIDLPDAWSETSGTAMFVYALVTGIREGWLDAREFAPAVRNGWLGLTKRINKEGDISDVSEGSFISSDPTYYLNRRKCLGDLHGQAPVLWTAAAFLRAPHASP